MNPNITKIIDQYLSGELNAEDKIVFEERMATNSELQAEVKLQETINEGIIRASLRDTVKKTGRKYHRKKLLKWSGMSVIALAIVTATSLYLFSTTDHSNDLPLVTKELKEDLEEYAQIENLPIQYFPIAQNGGVVLSAKGVLLSIPKEAFMINGKPYNGAVIVQFQEALSGGDIVKSGLSTMSGDRLLETQGMFGVAGFTPDGKELDFNPKVGVYVQTHVDEYKDKMQLFDGVKKADGTIDWQNPKPLEKLPVPVDMADLDFYPEGYEDHLDNEKWNKSKKSRDSLYLSLEGSDIGYIDGSDEEISLESLTYRVSVLPPCKITVEERDYLYGDNRAIDVNMTSMEATRLSKWKEGPRYESYFKYFNPDEHVTVSHSTGGYAVADTVDSDDYYETEDYAGPYYLSPSKVLAFWNKKFNNTNLATREFEKRVRVMHAKCGAGNPILKKYTNHLSKPMWKIDNEVAAMGYPEFKEFAAENIGVMNPDNPHIKGLQDFYEKGIQKLREQNRNYQNIEKKRRKNWDKEISDERQSEKKRTNKRTATALDQEYKFNMKHVKKHFGKTKGFSIKHGKGGVIKNIDAYVMEATVNRRTTTIIDPTTGKTTEIVYNKLSLEIENSDKYIKLFTYLFPSGINSYQRIPSKGGKFNYTLNNGMIYDIAVVGITEDGYEYFQKMSIKGGELGKIKLEGLTESDLEASIKQLNGKRISRPVKIDNELDWLIKERKDFKEQKMRKNMAAFRENLKCIAFPCHSCATPTQYASGGYGINNNDYALK